MAHQHTQRGFVLLITLLLIMLAAVALGGVARASLAGALAAEVATDQLQRRWAVASLQSVLLDKAEQILEQANEQADEPATSARLYGRLGNLELELIVTDEQSRVNINHLLAMYDRQRVTRVVRRLTTETAAIGGGLIEPQLSPLRTAPGPGGTRSRLRVHSFGQVFGAVPPSQLAGSAESAGLAKMLTCWGDGRLNWHRADRSAIEAIAESVGVPSATTQLLDARTIDSPVASTDLIRQLRGVSPMQRDRLAKVLADESRCHGLWVIARTPQRSWYHLAVAERREGQETLVRRYVW